MLTTMATTRDFLDMALKEDKDQLREVFDGAGIQCFHYVHDQMERTILSERNASDDRLIGLKDKMDTTEEILKQLGLFKM